MTVKDLKRHLERIMRDINNFDDEMEVNVSCNTYGMSNYGKGFLAVSEGFIDLNEPVRDEREFEPIH